MKNEDREPAFWPWVIVLGSGCAAVGYFLAQGDHVTATAMVAIILSALWGYGMRASRLLGLFCALFAASLLAPALAPALGAYCAPWFALWFGTSSAANRLLSVMVIGTAVALGSGVLQRRFAQLFPERRALEVVDRLAGFGLGAAQGTLLSWLVAGGLLVLEPIARDRLAADVQLRDHKFARVFAKQVVESAERTRDSAIGPIVADYNPFGYWGPLRELQMDVRAFADPLTKPPSESELAIEEHFDAH